MKKEVKKNTSTPVIKQPELAKVEERKADPRSLYPGKKVPVAPYGNTVRQGYGWRRNR
ncbi:MAG: hypothetical protein IPJ86_01875 [Bacteroidetes bacterium]|nr:hypothetical protein [Bacteroidota bacterium]